MSRFRLLACCLACLVLSTLSVQAQTKVKARVFSFRGGNAQDKPRYLRMVGRRFPNDPTFLGKLLVLDNEKVTYELWMSGTTEGDDGPWRAHLGMKAPSRANWYTNGFFRPKIGREELAGKAVTTVHDIIEGDVGKISITWAGDGGTVTSTFELRPGDERLRVTNTFKAKGDAKRWLVELVSYPGSMAGGSKAGAAFRDNEAITPTRTLTRQEREDNYGAVTVTLGKDEPWVLFYDKFFDVAKTPELKDRWKSQVGEGPCAMAYNPAEVVRAVVKVSNYSCEATLLYAPTTTESHLQLWDLHGQTNDQAKRTMKTVELDVKTK